LVGLLRHAATLISLQWCLLVLTLRLAVYSLRYLGKQDQIWANIFCIPKNMHSRTLMVSCEKIYYAPHICL